MVWDGAQDLGLLLLIPLITRAFDDSLTGSPASCPAKVLDSRWSFTGPLFTTHSCTSLTFMAALQSSLQSFVSGAGMLWDLNNGTCLIRKDEGSHALGSSWVVGCGIFLLSIQQKV
jgi:hypothetical protein